MVYLLHLYIYNSVSLNVRTSISLYHTILARSQNQLVRTSAVILDVERPLLLNLLTEVHDDGSCLGNYTTTKPTPHYFTALYNTVANMAQTWHRHGPNMAQT